MAHILTKYIQIPLTLMREYGIPYANISYCVVLISFVRLFIFGIVFVDMSKRLIGNKSLMTV